MKVGPMLKAYRKALGKSLDELSREIGIERTALHRLEAGRMVNADKWRAFIHWLLS